MNGPIFLVVLICCSCAGIAGALADQSDRAAWLSKSTPPDNFQSKSKVGPMETSVKDQSIYVVRSENTSLKAEPDVSAKTITTLKKGEYLIVEGHAPLLDTSGMPDFSKMRADNSKDKLKNTYWYKVRTETGARGFLNGTSMSNDERIISFDESKKIAAQILNIEQNIRMSRGPLKQYAGLYLISDAMLKTLDISKGADSCYPVPAPNNNNMLPRQGELDWPLKAQLTWWVLAYMAFWTDENNIHSLTFVGAEQPKVFEIKNIRNVSTDQGNGKEITVVNGPAPIEHWILTDHQLKIINPTGATVSVKRCSVENLTSAKQIIDFESENLPAKFYPNIYYWAPARIPTEIPQYHKQ